eukprot:Polyplicarium_translucidae@DN2113_c0_g1_i4.p1
MPACTCPNRRMHSTDIVPDAVTRSWQGGSSGGDDRQQKQRHPHREVNDCDEVYVSAHALWDMHGTFFGTSGHARHFGTCTAQTTAPPSPSWLTRSLTWCVLGDFNAPLGSPRHRDVEAWAADTGLVQCNEDLPIRPVARPRSCAFPPAVLYPCCGSWPGGPIDSTLSQALSADRTPLRLPDKAVAFAAEVELRLTTLPPPEAVGRHPQTLRCPWAEAEAQLLQGRSLAAQGTVETEEDATLPERRSSAEWMRLWTSSGKRSGALPLNVLGLRRASPARLPVASSPQLPTPSLTWDGLPWPCKNVFPPLWLEELGRPRHRPGVWDFRAKDADTTDCRCCCSNPTQHERNSWFRFLVCG